MPKEQLALKGPLTFLKDTGPKGGNLHGTTREIVEQDTDRRTLCAGHTTGLPVGKAERPRRDMVSEAEVARNSMMPTTASAVPPNTGWKQSAALGS